MFLKFFRRFLILSMLLSAIGCGDCSSLVDPRDFVPDDVFPSDVPDFGPKRDAGDTSVTPDSGRKLRDVDFNFDFGDPDQGVLPFAITAVVPNSGPLKGGNQVRIVGNSLGAGTIIFVGSQKMDVELVSGALVGRIPKGSGPGSVTVKAISESGEIRALVDSYTYVEDLRIDTISPTQVRTIGGTEIEIRGAGFREPLGVSFSRTDALRVRYVSDKLIRVVVPPRPRGFSDVRITTFSESTKKTKGIEYFDEVIIDRIEPASGRIAGGEKVSIFGTGFTSTSTVKFDGQSAEVLSVDINQGKIRVKTPSHDVGLADIFVSASKTTGVLNKGFYFRDNDTLKISNIIPNFGPSSGGNTARIIGFGLDDTNVEFFFDGKKATVLKREETFVDVQVPSGNVGDSDLVLKQSGTEKDRLIEGYHYLNDLELDVISPTSGPSEGGTQVTLSGKGFTGTTEVKVDGVGVSFQIISDTEIALQTESHHAGKVNITVKREGLKATLIEAYSFLASIEIWGFSPTNGARAGGTFVEVRGRGFFGDLSALVDGIPGTNIKRLDRNNVVFFTPAHNPGQAKLVIKNDTHSADGPYPFFYFEPASRFGGASGNEVEGAVNVTVFGLGEGALKDAFVMLSTRAETQYQGFTDANGQITLSGPAVIGAQTTTATAAGYSTATLQTVDAENITILLNKLDPTPGSGSGDPPPEARIFGTIKADAKIADPEDENTYDMAVVRTTQLSASGSSFPPPGNNSVVIGQQGSFDIRSRVGDLALIGLCGTFHQPSQVFTPKFLAIERFIFLGNKDELEVNLKCDIPLDQTHHYKIVNGQFAPSGPNINRVRLFWSFGFEGVFPSRTLGQGLGSIISVSNQPEAKGKIDDLKIIAQGGSFTGFGSPFSLSTLLDITETDVVIEMPTLLDVPHALRPLPGGQVVNNQISFAGGLPFEPDFYIGIVRNEIGIPVYQFILPGNETTFVLPTFPDFSNLPVDKRPAPLQQGVLNLTIIAARMRAGHTYESFSYRDIDAGLWESYAQNSWAIRLPTP